MRKIFNFIYEWLDHEESFIFWMVLMFLASSGTSWGLAHFFRGNSWGLVHEFFILLCDIAIAFFAISVVDIVLYFLFAKHEAILKTVKFFLLAINAVMFFTDLFTIYYFKSLFSEMMFEFLTMTNMRESSEFLQAYLGDFGLWEFAAVVAMLMMLCRIFWIKFLNRKLRFAVLTMAFALSLVASGRQLYLMSYARAARFINSIGATRLANLVYTTRMNLKNLEKNSVYTQKAVTLTKNESSIPNIVFVLGESTTRNHMSLYGYELTTNPLLTKREDSRGGGGKLFIFDDVISPATSTEASMHRIFNFSNYESKNEWFTYSNLFTILKAAGYHTAWLSTQEIQVFDATTSASYPKICDVYVFPDLLEASKSPQSGGLKDEIILTWLDELLPDRRDKNFFLLHLLGTHFHYNHRFTEPFRKFTPDDEFKGNGFDGNMPREVRAAYDNAILYNDFIVNEIIKRFEDDNAIVIYISDHGDEVYDSKNFFGHGDMGAANENMLEIPFVIWLSEKFRAQYPEIEKRIAASVHKPYMTDDLIHTILDIAGIETSDYDSTRSVINENFNANRPRIFKNFIYDKEKGLVEIQ